MAARKERRVNIRRLRPWVRQILQTDVVGRSVPLSYPELRALLIALSVATGKGLVEWEKSKGLVTSLWEDYPPAPATDEALYRCVEAIVAKDILTPWVTLSEGAIHSAIVALLVVVERSRATLSDTLAEYEKTWGHYEVPPELAAS